MTATLEWIGTVADGHLRLLDQTRLPLEVAFRDCLTPEDVWQAIKQLQVRGAPAIGVAAAYGVVLGARTNRAVGEVCAYLATSRPTAVNLFWALDRMQEKWQTLNACHDAFSPAAVLLSLWQEAESIHQEDTQTCRRIGVHGLPLMRDGMGVLTHCNAGALATTAWGTALAPLFLAHDQGRRFTVFVDETRPLLQGARLTAWELQQRGIETVVICDNMAAHVMKQGKVQLVIVGADRIAANGDTANKIGTYGLALLAQAHGIPFYVAAPMSTFDLSLADGSGIPIEERMPAEIAEGFGRRTAPEGVRFYNPAFDVTPAAFIHGIITENGIIQPVTQATIQQLCPS